MITSRANSENSIGCASCRRVIVSDGRSRRRLSIRFLIGTASSPIGSQCRRPAGLHWRCDIEVELAQQPGKSNTTVTLNLDLRPGPRGTVPITKHDAVLGNGLASLNAAIPCLTCQGQQPEVV